MNLIAFCLKISFQLIAAMTARANMGKVLLLFNLVTENSKHLLYLDAISIMLASHGMLKIPSFPSEINEIKKKDLILAYFSSAIYILVLVKPIQFFRYYTIC